jgi:hypothetical protein
MEPLSQKIAGVLAYLQAHAGLFKLMLSKEERQFSGLTTQMQKDLEAAIEPWPPDDVFKILTLVDLGQSPNIDVVNTLAEYRAKPPKKLLIRNVLRNHDLALVLESGRGHFETTGRSLDNENDWLPEADVPFYPARWEPPTSDATDTVTPFVLPNPDVLRADDRACLLSFAQQIRLLVNLRRPVATLERAGRTVLCAASEEQVQTFAATVCALTQPGGGFEAAARVFTRAALDSALLGGIRQVDLARCASELQTKPGLLEHALRAFKGSWLTGNPFEGRPDLMLYVVLQIRETAEKEYWDLVETPSNAFVTVLHSSVPDPEQSHLITVASLRVQLGRYREFLASTPDYVVLRQRSRWPESVGELIRLYDLRTGRQATDLPPSQSAPAQPDGEAILEWLYLNALAAASAAMNHAARPILAFTEQLK